MVFAKALCVVLLLCRANFGDARSSGNETISEKRTALSPKAHDLTQSVRRMEIEEIINSKWS
jgi:hypothetical protein